MNAEPDATANAGGASPFQSSASGPPWLRLSFDTCKATTQEMVKRVRVFLLFGIGLAAMSCFVWQLLLRSPSPQSYESVKTRLLFQTAKGSRYIAFDKAFRHFHNKAVESRSRDLYEAVNAGLVKRVNFTEQHADFRRYQDIASLLRTWAFTNGVQIASQGVSGDGLIVYVLASDEWMVTNLLSSLTTHELRPFE